MAWSASREQSFTPRPRFPTLSTLITIALAAPLALLALFAIRRQLQSFRWNPLSPAFTDGRGEQSSSNFVPASQPLSALLTDIAASVPTTMAGGVLQGFGLAEAVCEPISQVGDHDVQ